MLRKLLFTTASMALIVSCQNPENTGSEKALEVAEDKDVVMEPEHDAPESYEKGGLKIYPKEEIAKFEDASLKLRSPEDKEVISAEEVQFAFEVEGYELGKQTEEARMGLANSGNGQHIHLIVDNGPYSAHYDPEFTRSVSKGYHYAIAFLSRSYHESVKSDDASVVFQFTTGSDDQDDPRVRDLSQPLLFYSRPKGTYSGEDAKKILFDFYVKNTELSADGYSVLTTINDSLEFEFDTWQPYIIEGLPMGENTITIQLVDATGMPVNSEINSVSRTFTLEE